MRFCLFLFWTFLLSSFGFAADVAAIPQGIEIIPEANQSNVISNVNSVGKEGGHVWDNYDEVLKNKPSLEDSLASWIMDWDTILLYAARFVNYMSQLWIFIGACFLVYAGYVYATSIFNNGDVKKWNTAIHNALLWVVIITFSYALMKFIVSAFL